jgi:hypothetical protein
MKLAPNRDVQQMGALALARAGDTAVAKKLADEVDTTFPLDTLAQRDWLPVIRAAIALRAKPIFQLGRRIANASTSCFPRMIRVCFESTYQEATQSA